MRTSSTTATFTMNDAGRDVLFPSAAAIAHKIDVWAQAIATLNNSKNTINVAIAGQNAITTERIHTSLNEYTGSVSGSFTKSNTSAIYVIKIANGFHAAGVRDTSITAYFTQYFCAANKAGKGVKNISVSNAAPYEGETVTFSAELYNGANFEGWYSDEACTQLVSSNLTYSTTAADLTLYAKATIDANLYNVSAVAGSEIANVSVSDSIVPDGDTATFTAQVNTGCSFEGWYSNDTYTTVVSTENPYTVTITANTTLYAKAHRSSLNMSVGSTEHGAASVSATTVPYGNDVTFTFTPEDETWELYGWYSDSALTQLVSEANPYTFTATEDTALYPKVGIKRYTITLRFTTFQQANVMAKLAVVDFNALTNEEIGYLKSGDYAAISADKVYDTSSVTSSFTLAYEQYSTSIRCPMNLYVAMSVPNYEDLSNKYYRYIKDYTWWPYYWYLPTQDASFTAGEDNNISTGNGGCNCTAIAKDNISSVDVTTPIVATKEAIFTAKVNAGSNFTGWYSDEACTKLVSSNNPAYVATPKEAYDEYAKRPESSLTLYAKATKAIYTISVGTTKHGSATVSKSTAYYGDTVTFNCTVDEDYEFKGWYSDEGLTQLVSEAANYEHTVTGSIILWPKVEIITYKITFQADYSKNFGATEVEVNIAAIDFESLTRQEKEYLKTGNYNLISSDKVYDMATDKGNQRERTVSVSVDVPKGKYVAMYAPEGRATTLGNDRVVMFYIEDQTGEETKKITNWPYYWYEPTQDMIYSTIKSSYRCKCVAIPKEGISYVDATTPVSSPNEPDAMPDGNVYTAVFSAEISPGYEFSGWYSDEECTVLASPNNPAYIITPEADGKTELTYTLYAKATRIATGTGIYIKQNGTFFKATTVFKKTNGAWVQQSNPASLFTGSPSGTESNYLYLGE